MNEYVCVFNLGVSYLDPKISMPGYQHDPDRASLGYHLIDYGTLHATLKLPFIPAKSRSLCFDGDRPIHVIKTVYDLVAMSYHVETSDTYFDTKEELDAFLRVMSAKGWKHQRPDPKSNQASNSYNRFMPKMRLDPD